MIQKLVTVTVFVFVIIGSIQLMSRAFARVYTMAEQTVAAPYAQAQAVYNETNQLAEASSN